MQLNQTTNMRTKDMNATLHKLLQGLPKSLVGYASVWITLGLTFLWGYAAAQALPANQTLEDAMRAQRDRSAKITSKAQGAPVTQTMPNIDTYSLKNADPSLIIEQYQTLKEGVETAQREEGFLIFVSLSMPAESLNRLVDQAIRFNAPLIIRGTVNDSLAATVAKVSAVLNKREAEFQIDPRLFTRFNIASIPAFVAISPDNRKSGTIFGDVSASYALETMERSMPQVSAYAKQRLAMSESKNGGKR
jgi:conjugal transfer pilus assembly protein TrbC